MPVTLDLTSSLPQPLEEDDLHKQQSIATKHYRIQQYIGKKRSGLTPPMPYEPVKSKYTLYIYEISIGICPTGMTKGCTSH